MFTEDFINNIPDTEARACADRLAKAARAFYASATRDQRAR
jgi:hypothetical protein